ncbi:MAG: restriction endonuclease [Candidatus Poribacteria bacterium]|nr:restriction endonuclease [Candidatus Poribacteria bacterium]
MADTTNKPKQMTAYDKFEIRGDEEYILCDDVYHAGEDEETICKNPLQDINTCAYCSTRLEKIENNTIQGDMHRDYCLWYCHYCRYWQARIYSAFQACMPPPDNWAYVSKLREFDTNLPEGCSEELALYIRKHPNFLYSCHPTRFEKFVADVFRANYTNAEVLHVGRPHDGGTDVLLIDAEKRQWLIQVKRRESPSASEGVGIIRDILGAMHLKGVRRGIVVSNADRFSRYAQKAAVEAEAKEYPMIVRLVNSDILDKMLDPVLPDRPWLDPISEVDEEISSYLADQIPTDKQLYLFEEPNHLLN